MSHSSVYRWIILAFLVGIGGVEALRLFRSVCLGAVPLAENLGKMMQEVSLVTAYDAHAYEQMSEEEILACLVAETEPTFNVPTKKVKLGASRLQIMDDDPLDEYLKENRRLQQASLRLEQENDSLAHRLITSKVALRNALDEAEDRVEELTKDLLQAHHQLQATEEEKRSKEEEVAKKEVFRRELERAEQEIKKYSGVILDYKQICSQLTLRLERQEAAHREELEALKSTIEACSQCRHISESITAGHSSETAMPMEGLEVTEQGRQGFNESPPRVDRIRENQEKEPLKAQIRELEKELAQTKLQVVETNCKIQELEHQNGVLANDLQETKNNWISKALTSLWTTTGGHHSIGMHREGPATLNWNLHTSSLSGWTPKKPSWPHKHHSKNV